MMAVRAVNWYRFDCDAKECNETTTVSMGVEIQGRNKTPLEEAADNAEEFNPGWRVFIRPLSTNAFCPRHAKMLDTED